LGTQSSITVTFWVCLGALLDAELLELPEAAALLLLLLLLLPQAVIPTRTTAIAAKSPIRVRRFMCSS
jgi:hypothetical protein